MKRLIASFSLLTVLLMMVACPRTDEQMSASFPTTGTIWSSTTGLIQPGTIGTPGVSASTLTSQTVPVFPTTLPMAPTTRPSASATLPPVPTKPTPPITMPEIPSTPTTLPTMPAARPSTSQTPSDPGGNKPEIPVLDNQWVIANCDFVNLRQYADTHAPSLRRILVGERVKLLEWYGKFGKVQYGNKTGYVLASYMAPADSGFMTAALDTVTVTDTYTYQQMMEDLITFHQQHPDRMELEIIGYSALEAQIPVVRLGDLQAAKHVLIHGGIHGREHMTTWLLMALLDYWLDQDPAIFEGVCFHMIPMVNPDGVTISQSGQLPDSLMHIYESDLQKGYTTLNVEAYARQWKANGQGVDLNRNFPAGWETVTERTSPSSERYRGTAPFSAPETQMLRDYTQRFAFAVTISYHATGSAIYYEYGNQTAVNAQSKSLGNAIYDLTGYYLLDSDGVDAAGYKDWAIDQEKIPSLTIEIGCLGVPLVKREAYSIFGRNLNVLPEIVKWLQKQ